MELVSEKLFWLFFLFMLIQNQAQAESSSSDNTQPKKTKAQILNFLKLVKHIEGIPPVGSIRVLDAIPPPRENRFTRSHQIVNNDDYGVFVIDDGEAADVGSQQDPYDLQDFEHPVQGAWQPRSYHPVLKKKEGDHDTFDYARIIKKRAQGDDDGLGYEYGRVIKKRRQLLPSSEMKDFYIQAIKRESGLENWDYARVIKKRSGDTTTTAEDLALRQNLSKKFRKRFKLH